MQVVDFAPLVSKLNTSCRGALENAAGTCLSRTHYEITVEHLMARLLEDPMGDTQLILKQAGIDPGRVMRALDQTIEAFKTGSGGKPQFSPLLPELFADGWLIASVELFENRIRSGALFAAFVARLSFYGVDSYTKLLEGLTKQKVIELLGQVAATSREAGESGSLSQGAGAGSGAAAPGDTTGSALQRFCEDFTAKARAGKVDPVFGRDPEIRQMVDILARRRKNNPICVGDPGVGKTAVIEGLAVRVIEGDVPDILKDVTILGLDMGALEAGAGVKGEFENRLRGVINEIKASTKPILLFIDEAHTLIGAGGAAGTNDAANLLKPALARGELRTIAATTWSEYKKYFEKDPALARRFELVKLDEPSVEMTVQILRGLKSRYEDVHQVIVRDDALHAAAELSHRYITGRQLPDKAIDLFDTACARIKVNLSSKPDFIEDRERKVQMLEREKLGLLRDQDNGVSVDLERLAEIAKLQSSTTEELVGLQARFDKELQAARTVVSLRQERAQFKKSQAQASGVATEPATPPEAGATPASPSESADSANVAPQAVAQIAVPRTLEQIEQDIHKAEAVLAEFQVKEKLVFIEVAPDTIAKVVSDRTGVPLGKMLRDHAANALALEQSLEARIKGQNHAIAAIAEVLKSASSGLRDPDQPMGVFLLAGPSGTGKTETALSVADMMFGGEQSIVTINMSEFQEKHTVSRLVGSPPGYVGYGEGGVLTEAVRQRPYTVVLLDEVEKAHLDVVNLFYQVFDKGILSDGEGREINFRNTVVFLTSNLALDVITELCSGDERPDPAVVMAAVRPILSNHFKPALLARMTVVPFYTLPKDALRGIVDLKLKKVINRMATNNKITLEITDTARNAITARCTEVETGARNIDFILRGTILPLLSNSLLESMAKNTHPAHAKLAVDAAGEFVATFS
jgi:type VI secretion system protein VasG